MITDRERSLANLCSTRSRRELSNQVNFESMRAIPILTDGQTFAPRHYRASIDPVHGLRARERNANGQKIGGREKWQYLGEQCSFGILSRAGRTIPSNGPWGSIGRVWRRKSVGQEIKYYPRGARASSEFRLRKPWCLERLAATKGTVSKGVAVRTPRRGPMGIRDK